MAVLKNNEASPGWRPTSLRKTTFLTFALVSVACIATLAALFAISRANNGLRTVDVHLHYLWTYIPTLFFTVAGACWSRAAYRVRQMQPWRMITRSHGSMSEALLVDYVTPTSLASLSKAIRARHSLVAIALLASMALQLVTILSTGLFGIDYLPFQKNAPIHLLDSITGVAHDFSTVSAGPDLTIYSIQNTNLSYPEGTTSLYAVPRLSYPEASNATLTAPLEVFASDLRCELASLHVDNLTQTSIDGIHHGPQFTYSLRTGDCLVNNQTVIGGKYVDYNLVGMNFVFSDTYGNIDAVTCSSNESDVRIRISVGLIHYNITWNGTEQDLYQKNESVVLPSSWSDIYSLPASTNLLCVPQYGLQKAEVTYMTDQATGSRQVQVRGFDPTYLRALEGLTSETLSNAILDSVTASTLVIGALYPNPNANVIVVNGPSESEGGYFPTHADAFFTTMTQRYPPVNGSIKSTWFEPEFLQNASTEFYASVSAQFASQYLRRDTDAVVLGTSEVTEPRLVVLSAVFYAIEALLGVFALAALALTWPASKSIAPIDPASIGGTTAMLCSDTELIDRFRGTGSYGLSELRSLLLGDGQANRRTGSSRPHEPEKKSKFRNGHSTASHNRSHWWRPFVFRPFLREIVLVVPLVAIVALEVTLHVSQKNNGLVSVDSNGHEVYAFRLVPAIVFSAIRMLLQTVAFNVSLLTPLSTLRKGPCAARFGLLDNPLTRFPLQNLWTSARKGQVALFCSIVMTTAAFFLVTVSSGLFVTGAYTQPSNLTQLSWFQPTLNNNDSAIQGVASDHNLTEPIHYSQDNGEVTAHLVGNGIIELNLSYPAWTFGELAFPLLSLSDISTTHAGRAASVAAEIPAIRAALDCDVLKDDEVSISYQSRWDNSLGMNFTFQLATVESPLLPQFQSCPQGNNFALEAFLPGRLNTSEGGLVEPRLCSSFGIYCSNLAGIYGYATDEAFVNYSVISCRVSYEQVSTTTAFELPNYVISKDAPPTVDETQTSPLNSSDVNSFLNSVDYFAAFYNTSLTTFNGYSTMDSLAAALIYGKDGIPAEQLFQRPPEEHLIPSLRHMIRVMAAQYMSYFYRTANSSVPLVGSTIPATLQMGPDFRLKQNAASTRVLDVLLAVSWLFAVMTVFTFRSSDVAKAQPGTLAATLALVADSEFVHNMQAHVVQSDPGRGGTEGDSSLRKSANSVQVEQELCAEGSLFSLGWWSDAVGPQPTSTSFTATKTVPTTTMTTTTTTSTSLLGDQDIRARRRWGIDIGRAE